MMTLTTIINEITKKLAVSAEPFQPHWNEVSEDMEKALDEIQSLQYDFQKEDAYAMLLKSVSLAFSNISNDAILRSLFHEVKQTVMASKLSPTTPAQIPRCNLYHGLLTQCVVGLAFSSDPKNTQLVEEFISNTENAVLVDKTVKSNVQLRLEEGALPGNILLKAKVLNLYGAGALSASLMYWVNSNLSAIEKSNQSACQELLKTYQLILLYRQTANVWGISGESNIEGSNRDVEGETDYNAKAQFKKLILDESKRFLGALDKKVSSESLENRVVKKSEKLIEAEMNPSNAYLSSIKLQASVYLLFGVLFGINLLVAMMTIGALSLMVIEASLIAAVVVGMGLLLLDYFNPLVFIRSLLSLVSDTPRLQKTSIGGDIGHAIGFAVWRDRLYYINRNTGGIKIFNYPLYMQGKDLSLFSSNESLEKFLSSLTLLDEKAMMPQQSGNCPMIALKGMYWFASYISAIKELECYSNAHELAMNMADKTYKDMSLKLRLGALNDYFDGLDKHQIVPDSEFLAKLYVKVSSPKWRQNICPLFESKFDDNVKTRAVEVAFKSLETYLYRKGVSNAVKKSKAQHAVDLMHHYGPEGSGSSLLTNKLCALSLALNAKEYSTEDFNNACFNVELLISCGLDRVHLGMVLGGSLVQLPKFYFSDLNEFITNSDPERLEKALALLERCERGEFSEDVLSPQPLCPKPRNPLAAPRRQGASMLGLLVGGCVGFGMCMAGFLILQSITCGAAAFLAIRWLFNWYFSPSSKPFIESPTAKPFSPFIDHASTHDDLGKFLSSESSVSSFFSPLSSIGPDHLLDQSDREIERETTALHESPRNSV